MSQHCLGGLFRDIDHYEVFSRVQIVFLGFVYHADVIVGCSPFVGQNNINFADFKRFGIPTVIYAEGVAIWILVTRHSSNRDNS
ncbi:MAG: hypothetical protein JWM21_621 [Acidobacteria bacterium]|nr:hypothetical protein [Acidobacteriota bacterium]